MFASWLGWLVTPDRPLIFVTDDTTDGAELLRQCANVGYDRIAGELAGGFDAWADARLPVASVDVVAAEHVHGPVLDVRQTGEHQAGHVPGARNLELGSLANVAEKITEPVTVMCGHGQRAASAASILLRHGNTNVRIVTGGPDDWAATTGRPLDTGP